MFNRFSFISLVFLFSNSVHAAQIEYRLNKIHGLVNFAETAAGEPHRSMALKEHFEKSLMNTPEVKAILERFKKAYRHLGEGFSYQGFPNMRMQGNSGETLLLIQSVYAKDMAELESRTIGFMPMSQHRELIGALKSLLPHYEKGIWNPSLKKLQKKKMILEQLSKKAQVDTLFDLASKFYGASWPADRKFVIALYPIPGERGHSSAQSLESVESVGVMTDEKDDAGRFGVIFHELCHSLYDTQSAEFQEEFEKWFGIEKSSYGNLAYYRINEALATALGNGFVFERATGKADESSWYNDKYIEGLARGIYPSVKEYVSQKKQLDKTFVENAVSEFQKRFPDAPYEYANLFNRVVILIDAEGFNRTDIRDAMNKSFRVSSRSIYNSLEGDDGITELKSSTDTAIVIVSKSNQGKLLSLAKKIGKAEKVFQEAVEASEDGLFWTELSPGRSLLIMKAASTQGILGMFASMQKAAKLDSSTFKQVFK